IVAKASPGIRFNEHIEGDGPTVFAHACKMGLEGVVSKRKDSMYRSGRSPDWLKMKNPNAPAVKREAEEDWGRKRWRGRYGRIYPSAWIPGHPTAKASWSTSQASRTIRLRSLLSEPPANAGPARLPPCGMVRE